MIFLGQPTIMNQLSIYLPYLLSNPAEGMGFFVSGPSGWGKTRLCLLSCNYLAMGNGFQHVMINPNSTPVIDRRYHVHFFDEVHLLAHPEMFYRALDDRTDVFFFATNIGDGVPEPLINRCVPLTMEPYSESALIEIARKYYPYDVTDQFILSIVRAGSNNPRIISGLCKRLTMYTRQLGYPPENVDEVIETFFGIKDGLDIQARRYLDFLQRVGGIASIDAITAALHLSKSLILYQVEPVLLDKGLIRITSRGRRLQ